MTSSLSRLLYCAAIGLSLYACHIDSSAPQATTQAAESSDLLPDSLFILHDMTTTEIDPKILVHAREMDTIFKRKILVPIVISDITADSVGVDDTHIMYEMTGRYISKQKKIGAFTPVILFATGDDYSALFYVMLDSSLHLVSYYRIWGGLSAGPDDISDILITEGWDRHSPVIGAAEIHSYELNHYSWIDTLKKYDEVDSVSYLTRISAFGRFATTRLDSVRYRTPKNTIK